MAYLHPKSLLNNDGDTTDTDHGDSDTAAEISGLDGAQAQRTADGSLPVLLHTVKNQRSILALAVSASRIYAGTQGGELLVSCCWEHRILCSLSTDSFNDRPGH